MHHHHLLLLAKIAMVAGAAFIATHADHDQRRPLLQPVHFAPRPILSFGK
jgi:hypothetical protein